MTFNLRYASAPDGSNSWNNANQSPQRRDVAVRVITNRHPDLIGFQEGEDSQLGYLDTNLPAYYAFEKQRPSGGSGGAENAAFAYNTNVLELIDRGVFSLGQSPGGGYWNNTPGTNFEPYIFFSGMGLNFPRLALWGRFRWRSTGQELEFYTTHFDFNNDPQVGSARLITDDARSRNNLMPESPLAVSVGDYNSSQSDNDWKLFTGSYTNNGVTGDFTDSYYQVHGTWDNSGTYHAFSGGIIRASDRIDWILHRGGFAATSAVIVTDSFVSTNITTGASHIQYPSDHYPVYADLQWPDVRADYDRDGLPDQLEQAATNLLPADADTDNDGLADGLEDLNGNGLVEGGETDPAVGGNTQKPTDIRNYQMDGILDSKSSLLASHGMDLYWEFDGRYLYVSTQDAGEGSDHFIFLTTNPDDPVSAPWAKSGQVAQWVAFLADENDNGFCGWFNASKQQITNLFTARSATYYENGGKLEGVLDLAEFFGAGFTNVFYLAVAPYGTTNEGILYAAAQVPEGNGDGNLLGTSDYVKIDPGDLDHDGISDYADPDQDGDSLPDEWESTYGLNTASSNGNDGASGDPDQDGAANRAEWGAGTSPTSALSVFQISPVGISGTNLVMSWAAIHKKRYHGWGSADSPYSNGIPWLNLASNVIQTNFPVATSRLDIPILDANQRYFRLQVEP